MVTERDKREKKVFLLLGTNLGERMELLTEAKKLIEQTVGKMLQSSSIYASASWGDEEQPDYLNQVLLINSTLGPMEVLHQCLAIERQLGRERNAENQWAARKMDIDLLFYESRIIEENDLIVPHPRLHLRNFTLKPLAEIAGNFVHPKFNFSIIDLLNRSSDPSDVVKYRRK